MRCLTDAEVSSWLVERGIPEDPYRKETPDASPVYYIQASVPRDYRRIDFFMRENFGGIFEAGPCLVHVTDWALYKPSEMIVIDGLRAHHGESRWLIDAPGHLSDADETETAIALFSLCASFERTCYLYSAADRCSLLNWEGEIFDFWTANPETLVRFRELLKDFGFSETCPPS